MKTLTYKFRKNMSIECHRAKKRWQLYLMLVIPFSLVLIFSYMPMFGIQIAFRDFKAARGIWGSDWVGLLHFKTFFKSFYFNRVVTNTLIISLYSLMANFPLQIIFALLLNIVTKEKFKKIVQTITYMPHFISTVVIVGILFQFFNNVTGVY
ncbi:MAG: sugar ABC transporter permease, partial [Clostridiaceae bacterium]|nr:sugar ABC transporter permease [Clostridiaceae bacterium]